VRMLKKKKKERNPLDETKAERVGRTHLKWGEKKKHYNCGGSAKTGVEPAQKKNGGQKE